MSGDFRLHSERQRPTRCEDGPEQPDQEGDEKAHGWGILLRPTMPRFPDGSGIRGVRVSRSVSRMLLGSHLSVLRSREASSSLRCPNLGTMNFTVGLKCPTTRTTQFGRRRVGTRIPCGPTCLASSRAISM